MSFSNFFTYLKGILDALVTNGVASVASPIPTAYTQANADDLASTMAAAGNTAKTEILNTTTLLYETHHAGLADFRDSPRYTRGAALVSAFVPSDYTGKVTSVEAGVTGAIATGATTLLVQNLETTSITEFAVVAFGTSAANAQANLGKTGTTPNIISESGVVVRSGDATLGILPESRPIGIPALATHFAIGNGAAGDDQVCMVTQGIGGV